jgi:hypothetical protein
MRALSVTPLDLAARFGFARGTDGVVTWSGLGDLTREAAGRWSLMRRATLQRFVARALDASGVDDEGTLSRLGDAVDQLIHLGDLEPVYIGEPDSNEIADTELDKLVVGTPGVRLAATRPRYVPLGERLLLVGLSAGGIPVATERFGGAESSASLARWAANDDLTRAQLDAAGFAECEVEDWMGLPGWLEYQERRRAAKAADLAGLWSLLLANLDQFGMPVSDAGSYALIAGTPGRYFGRPEKLDGRWVRGDVAPVGVWCGVVHGHGERHLRPVVVDSKNGRAVRALELYDLDELRWALLARGCHEQREVVRAGGGRLDLTFPCPSAWRRVAALCKVEAWRWSLPPWVCAADLAPVLEGVLLQEAPNPTPR